jgi:hypothetical protein
MNTIKELTVEQLPKIHKDVLIFRNALFLGRGIAYDVETPTPYWYGVDFNESVKIGDQWEYYP